MGQSQRNGLTFPKMLLSELRYRCRLLILA
jgi:hypothetical protein